MEKIDGKIKCPQCGREVPLDALGSPTSSSSPVRSIPPLGRTSGGFPRVSRSLRGADPVKFRTRRSGAGGAGRDAVSTFKVPMRKTRKALRQSVGRFPLEPDFDVFDEENRYQIIASLPYHESLEDIRCKVVDGALVIESLLEGFNLSQEFLLPANVKTSSLKIRLKNGILNIILKKSKAKRKKKKGEQ